MKLLHTTGRRAPALPDIRHPAGIYTDELVRALWSALRLRLTFRRSPHAVAGLSNRPLVRNAPAAAVSQAAGTPHGTASVKPPSGSLPVEVKPTYGGLITCTYAGPLTAAGGTWNVNRAGETMVSGMRG